jgi:hypothetical protein
VANLASFGRLAKKRSFFPDFSSSRRQVGKNRRFCKTGTNPRFLQKTQVFVSVDYLNFFMFRFKHYLLEVKKVVFTSFSP